LKKSRVRIINIWGFQGLMKGIIIGGEYNEILVREKNKQKLELGGLLVAETDQGMVLLQVYDLLFGSQISQQNLELISGLHLEEGHDMSFMDGHLRNYILAKLKALVQIQGEQARSCKTLPQFLSPVRQVTKEDLRFLTKPKNPLFIGKLRSGSTILDVDIFLPGEEVFSHHILLPAATGKGKSNLISVMLWQTLPEEYCGILVLDPHDEYYGRNKPGLKDHPHKDKLAYYTPRNVPPGGRTLKINLGLLRPHHFNGVVFWSDAQKDALNGFYRTYKDGWIAAILQEQELRNFHESTLGVLKRKMSNLLNITEQEGQLYCHGIFDMNAGETTIGDIVQELEHSHTVIVDTSQFEGSSELLVGSLIAHEILRRYKRYIGTGELKDKPVISIFIEEAPRVLGKEVLERGPNIFSTIAREGRKFKVGLTAITQLPSLIPRAILANINTKIILGTEMKQERQALIESAAQDLSTDDRNIASLDKGEALITSSFARFAIPVKVPLFKEYREEGKTSVQKAFGGISLK